MELTDCTPLMKQVIEMVRDQRRGGRVIFPIMVKRRAGSAFYREIKSLTGP